MKTVLALLALLCLAGCGVTAEDEPEPITTPVPTATPTVASRPASPTPCAPESSASRQVRPPTAPTQ
jgi:flagellar basal body L-ring protein FlgH